MKGLLDRDGVEYNEKLFDTERGIAGLGDEPFVSSTYVNIECNMLARHKSSILQPMSIRYKDYNCTTPR